MSEFIKMTLIHPLVVWAVPDCVGRFSDFRLQLT